MHDNPPLKCVGYGWILKDPRHARYALTKALRHIVRHTQTFAAYALCPKANGKVSCRAIRTGTLPRAGEDAVARGLARGCLLPRRDTTLTLAAPWHSLSRAEAGVFACRGRAKTLSRARPWHSFPARSARETNGRSGGI